MKKKLLFLLIFFGIIVTGCKTQEEIEQEKEKQRIDEITKEVEKNEEIPDETKDWMIDNKSKTVLTILCLKTSNRCKNIESNLSTIEKDIKVYYIELDDLEENVKNIYKTTYNLEDYTGYLPYVYIVSNNKLLATKSDVKNIDDSQNLIKENSK